MKARLRRIAQVTLLTAVLVFGALLIVGSFNTPSWSDPHHGYEHYYEKGYRHGGSSFYESAGHDH